MKNTQLKRVLNSMMGGLAITSLTMIVSACSSPEESVNNHMDKANQYLKVGNASKAMLEFKNVLQIEPNSVPAYYGMALAFQQNNDLERVYQFCKHVVELDPKHVDANLKLASLYIASNQMDRALDRLTTLESIAADNPQVMATKSLFLYKSGDIKGAVDMAHRALNKDPKNVQATIILASDSNNRQSFAETFNTLAKGIKNNPDDVSLILLRIETLEKSGQISEAQTELKKLIKQYPANTDYLKQLVYLHHKQGEDKQAEEALKAIIKQNPDDNAAIFDLVKFKKATQGDSAALGVLDELIGNQKKNAELKFFKVFFLNKLGRKDEARQLLVQLSENASDLESAHKAGFMLALEAFQQGNEQESKRLIEQVLAEDSRHQQTLLLKAAIATKHNDFKSAIADLRVILKDSPQSPPALVSLAKAHEGAGERELSEKYYKRAFDVSVNDTKFSLPYVDYLIRTNQLEPAKKSVDILLQAHPEDAKVLRYLAAIKISAGDFAGAESIGKDIKNTDAKASDQILGAVYLSQKNYDAGIDALQRNYSADPQNPEALLALIKSLVNADRKSEAVKMLQKIVDNNPSQIKPKIMLAQVLIKMHDLNAAINQYRAVIKDHPNQVDAYQQLGELLADSSRFDESKSVLLEGIKNVSDLRPLKLLLANVYQSEGDVDKAINEYEAYLKDYSDSVVAKNNYISLVSDFKTDAQMLERAYRLSQDLKGSPSAYVQDTIGWIAYKTKRYDEARLALLKAVETSPETAVFFFHLGLAQAALADKDGAIASLEKALKLKSAKNAVPVDVINKKINELKAG